MAYTFSNTSGTPVITRNDGIITCPETTAISIKADTTGHFIITDNGKPLLDFYAPDITTINGAAAAGSVAGIYAQLVAVMKTNTSNVALYVPIGDETTNIATGTAKVTFRMPFAMTLTGVRATLSTASSSGLPTVDIFENGTTILSTRLSIDANEKTSTTAATPAVISDASLADDSEMTVDITVAGTSAKGLKIWLIGVRA